MYVEPYRTGYVPFLVTLVCALSPVALLDSSGLLGSVELVAVEARIVLPTSGHSSEFFEGRGATGATGIWGRGARSVRTTNGSSSSSSPVVREVDNCCFVSVAKVVASDLPGSSREEEAEATAEGRDVEGWDAVDGFCADALLAANSSFRRFQTLTGAGLCGEGGSSVTNVGLAVVELGVICESPFTRLGSGTVVGRGKGV